MKKEVSNRVMNILSRNAKKLKDELQYDVGISYSGISGDDIFMTAFEFIIRDQSLVEASEDDIMKKFEYKYRGLYFKAIKNSRLKQMIYANNLQAEKK